MPSGSPHSDSDPGRVDLYDSTYGRFDEATYAKIRRETWGEDIGQNGWITAAEQDRLIERLGVSQGHRLLDIACGSGGPTLRLAERTGASVVGIDINESGIAAARRQAAARGLESVATFQAIDASGPSLSRNRPSTRSCASTRSTTCPIVPRSYGPGRVC